MSPSRLMGMLLVFALAASGCESILGIKDRKAADGSVLGPDAGASPVDSANTDGSLGTGGSPGLDAGKDVVDAPNTGGHVETGGTTGAGGTGTAGVTGTGGAGSGGALGTGGSTGTGDSTGKGGSAGTGGIATTGGATSAGGTANTGGITATGGTAGAGGTTIADGGSTSDGGSVDPNLPDAGNDAAPACNVLTPFGTPVLLAGVNQTGTISGTGRLSPDELTIYFSSDRSGNLDIFVATRASRTDAFGPAQAVGGVNTSAEDSWPSVTSDGLAMFLESGIGASYQVVVSTRTTLAAQFPAPSPIASVNNVGPINAQPFVLPDKSALYFSSTREGGSGDYDLYRSGLEVSGQFGTPALVSAINTRAGEFAPTLSPDELIIYFASDRTDAPGKGNADIWMAKRLSRTANFDPPVNVQELNTTDLEEPQWLSPDYCRLYFRRGTYIYVATRTM